MKGGGRRREVEGVGRKEGERRGVVANVKGMGHEHRGTL